MDNREAGSLPLDDLIERARGGDKQAFSVIYERHLSPIYRFIYFRVRKKEDAEDLTQSVFTKALASIGRFQDQGLPITAWLFTIARNLTIDYWKKKRDVIVDEPEAYFSGIVDERSSASRTSEDKELGTVLKKAMGELSEDQQEVVILRCIEDRPYPEIAKVLGKNEEAIRALKHRALKNLKMILKDKYDYTL